MKITRVLALAAGFLSPLGLAGQEQHHHGAEGGDSVAAMERFGQVSFPISCAAESRKPFERGIALLHSFWYEEAAKQFAAVAAQDPTCAMAEWGLAMTEWRPGWDGLPEKRRLAGIKDIDEATAQKAKTDRERQYIAALSAFLHADPQAREKATADLTVAMGRLFAAYPDDVETRAFYGLALFANIGVTDPVGDARKALVVLQPGLAAHPDHPGFAHYIVHACDSPQLAREGLPAAQRYAAIAPSSPHALHMPGHIFARLGMWTEDIASNEASAKASALAETMHQGGVAHQMHADEFLLYAYLQEGNDARAKYFAELPPSLSAHLRALPDIASDGMAMMIPYVNVEYPGIYDLEMRDWAGALKVEAVPDPSGFASLYAQWVHGIAAGHLHDAVAAKVARQNIEEAFAAAKKRGIPQYYEITLQMWAATVTGWERFASRDDAAALKIMSANADSQDRFGQGEVDIPVREMYADMLLEMKRPAEALVQYKASLLASPNRFNGLYHAGLAAEGAGNVTDARAFYRKLLETTHNGADTVRPEITHAKSVAEKAQLAAN